MSVCQCHKFIIIKNPHSFQKQVWAYFKVYYRKITRRFDFIMTKYDMNIRSKFAFEFFCDCHQFVLNSVAIAQMTDKCRASVVKDGVLMVSLTPIHTFWRTLFSY